MRRTRILLAALAVLVPVVPMAGVPATVAHAAACNAAAVGAYPNDPQYAPAERGQAGSTWDAESWYLYGCVTTGTAPLSSDPQGASGMSVSNLWNRVQNPQRGRDDVTVGYVEGGVNWRIPASCELKDRAQLNTAELPFPEDSAGHTRASGNRYDLNNDGVVNVEDYVADPRVIAADVGQPKSPAPGAGPFLHHVCSGVGPGHSDITPEDLIVAFGHCQISNGAIVQTPCPANGRYDNDHNGYPNDINGWNFNRDNNDPQTEQSIYAHFDDESGQAIGEGNNAFANVGLCPLCRYVPIKAGDEAIDRPDRVAEAIVYAATIGIDVLDVTSASLGLNQTVQAAINYAYNRGTVVVFASNDFESADHTDGMFYAHVWPGNSITGDHSTRSGATCPTSPYCGYVLTNTTYTSRSSLTSYGPHALFSVPNNDGSTSTGTPTQAGVAALVVAEGRSALGRGEISAPLTANEVEQVVRSTAMPINAPCPPAEPCFSAPGGSAFNIQYGYGRPNVLAAASAIDANHIPPVADIQSPSWYQWVDPVTHPNVTVSANIDAARASSHSYSWVLQYGLGPQPNDSTGWTTFASGSGGGPATVSGVIDTAAIPSSFWGQPYAIDPQTRLSIEQYDVSVRVRVFANHDMTNAYSMGEDRRAFHLRHDPTELAGFPLNLGASGEASPTLADIEGRGQLDTIVATSDGKVHAIRPDGSEAPNFPVQTDVAIGLDSGYSHNYLGDPAWTSGAIPQPHDTIVGPLAVGDLNHTGALDIVGSTLNGKTYAWDGFGQRVFTPVLNGNAAQYGLSVPPPDTPYSFEPENVSFTSPVLTDLQHDGSHELDIIQAAGDNHVYAWKPDGTAVPGWPVSTLLPAGTVPAGSQQTHDSKVIPTPAIADINGDGIPDVVVGLDDSILGTGPAGAGVKAFLVAFDGRGIAAGASGGNPALLPGYPVIIPGLIQGYGVAQDFVTQGVESPAIYDDPVKGPQAVVNANLFAQYRVDLKTATVSATPFDLAHIPQASTTNSCPAPNSVPPTFTATCTLVPFTTAPSLGKAVTGSLVPQVVQAGSSATDVLLGITQTPGFGVRVDNGVAAWDPTTGTNLTGFNHYIQGLAFFGAATISDVSGDATPDVLQSADSSALVAYDSVTQQPVTGFPKWTGGWSLFAAATGDISGSGVTDVSVMTREGYLSAWSTAGNGCAGNSEAWHWHQDDRNTGHYGTDTRPPSAITDLASTTANGQDTLTFTAVGDDWKCGTAASYQLFTSANPINQGNVGSATSITVTTVPGASGAHESVSIQASQNLGYLAIRAVDHAGNIGPLEVAGSLPSNFAEFGVGPAAGLVAALGVAGVATVARRRKRSRR